MICCGAPLRQQPRKKEKDITQWPLQANYCIVSKSAHFCARPIKQWPLTFCGLGWWRCVRYSPSCSSWTRSSYATSCLWWAGRMMSRAPKGRTWWEKRLRRWAAFCQPCGWGLRTAGEFESLRLSTTTCPYWAPVSVCAWCVSACTSTPRWPSGRSVFTPSSWKTLCSASCECTGRLHGSHCCVFDICWFLFPDICCFFFLQACQRSRPGWTGRRHLGDIP